MNCLCGRNLRRPERLVRRQDESLGLSEKLRTIGLHTRHPGVHHTHSRPTLIGRLPTRYLQRTIWIGEYLHLYSATERADPVLECSWPPSEICRGTSAVGLGHC